MSVFAILNLQSRCSRGWPRRFSGEVWGPPAALNIGSGAVLIASIGAAIVGTIIFVNRLRLMDWW